MEQQSSLFLFGDVRGNENPGLTAIQILFLREHNRKAKQLAATYPTWTDEELYQESRRFVIGIMHHITEEEVC
jgi:peroxidase